MINLKMSHCDIKMDNIAYDPEDNLLYFIDCGDAVKYG